MRKPLETVDLSHLSDAPAREFEKWWAEDKKKEGSVKVFLHPDPIVNSLLPEEAWIILVDYSIGVKYRTFRGDYLLKAVPASLPRRLVRLGAPETFMRWLAATYAEILEAVRPVEREDVHTDTGPYDE